MAKFRKKPVVIEAYRWHGGEDAIVRLVERGTDFERFIIRTLEGDMQPTVGDWIVTGIRGEHYAVKPDIFEKTYEHVE